MCPSSPESSVSENFDEYEEWNGFGDEEDDEPNESGIEYFHADFDDDDDNDGGQSPFMVPDDVDKAIDDLAATIKSTVQPQPDSDPTLPFRNTSPARSARQDSVMPDADAADDPSWKSHMQLIQFRETTEEIAKNWLNDKGTKLRKSRKRSGVKGWNAFRKGQKDSKKIDVRRKTIQDHSKAEQEQSNELLAAFT